MIPISTLHVTQSYIRNPKQILGMIEYLWEHGNFSDLERKIVIKELDDGELYIHDGHHRVLALYMAYSWDVMLSDDEFIIKKFKYEDFMKINWECGWVTPLDIRLETRFSCVKAWKDWVKSMIQHYGYNTMENHIYSHGYAYKEPRKIHTIQDLYQKFLMEQLK